MKTGILIAVILMAGVLAQAKNFALVMAGSNVPGANELIMETAAASICLKQSGYEVQTLVGANDPKTSQMDNTASFPKDYQFLSEHASTFQTQPATVQNIPEQFNQLIKKVKDAAKSGDLDINVEIIVNAHGLSNCASKEDPNSGYNLPPYVDVDETRLRATSFHETSFHFGNQQQDCHHQIQVWDGQQIVWMNTRTLKSYVKALEDNGAKVNLNLNSCSSGEARNDFSDLKNACTYLASPPQGVGTGCDPNTPSDIKNKMWNSNTYVNMFRSCKGKFENLKSKEWGGYFSGNPCFNGLVEHVTNPKNKIDLSSMSSTYFSERSVSTSFESPLMGCFKEEFFERSDMANAFRFSQEYSCVKDEYAKIQKLTGGISDALMAQAWDGYSKALESYNKTIAAQKEMKPEEADISILSEQEQEKFKGLQQQAEGFSLELIRNERILFDRYRELHPEKFAACEQGPCSRKSP